MLFTGRCTARQIRRALRVCFFLDRLQCGHRRVHTCLSNSPSLCTCACMYPDLEFDNSVDLDLVVRCTVRVWSAVLPVSESNVKTRIAIAFINLPRRAKHPQQPDIHQSGCIVGDCRKLYQACRHAQTVALKQVSSLATMPTRLIWTLHQLRLQ
jgi:hypothetical protein